MRIVGLIAEYNPFHTGHQYHIQKAKEVSQADAVIVVMSGNYVQRGAPAIMPKHLRAKAALTCGADVVLELPLYYATGTAEQFAYGAVSLLHQLGCVDSICFGSECGEVKLLREIAEVLLQEPEVFQTTLQDGLKNGLSFPASRQKALEQTFPDKPYATILESPNNILGIEYIKALIRTNSNMIPYTISRMDSNYHDEELSVGFSSATAIRKQLTNGINAQLKAHIPEACHELYQTNYRKRYPIFSNDFSLLLKYKLLHESKFSIQTYADVSEELANRIYKNLNRFVSYDQFCELLKTKEITYSRISRALLHILLSVKKEGCEGISYARVLGFRSERTDVLSTIKKTASVPLVTKLTPDAISESEITASNLYESVVSQKYETTFINEYEHQIVRL